MSATESTAALRLAGRVQGVGFRAWVRQQAHGLGLRGYVRNLDDGRVEIVAAGAPDRVEALLARARIGPWGAKVEREESFDPGPTDGLGAFSVRF